MQIDIQCIHLHALLAFQADEWARDVLDASSRRALHLMSLRSPGWLMHTIAKAACRARRNTGWADNHNMPTQRIMLSKHRIRVLGPSRATDNQSSSQVLV